MTFQIAAITIYGARDDQVRTVDFRLGALNIVTGDSRRGKSSLLNIVDYCLGSSDYAVKAGKVRDYVRMYALTLVSQGRQLFVARPAPEGKASTTTRMCLQAQALGAPPLARREITLATPLDAAKGILGDFCGIDSSVRIPAVRKSAPIAPTIRHALFFCLQAQNEVANPDLLFHSQGEEWRPQTIREVIPYFLGAMDAEQALLRNKLRLLKRDLADLETKLAALATTAPASGQARALVTEAVEVGLLEPQHLDEPPLDELMELLQRAAAPDLIRSARPTADTDDPLRSLSEERRRLRSRLAQGRAQISTLRQAVVENNDFVRQATEQRSRLSTLGLLHSRGNGSGTSQCPVCDSEVPASHVTVQAIQDDLAVLEADLSFVGGDTPAVTQMIADEEEALQSVRAQLARNQEQMDALQAGLRAAARHQDDAQRAAMVQGRISLYLETVTQVARAPRIDDRRDDLRAQITEIELALSDETQVDRLASFVSLINQKIWAKARALGLEHADFPIRLDVRALTIVADTPQGPVRLEDMGSGENWVGYHVAAMLSLHEWFVEERGPVPNFLILDQPSQVYFPADYSGSGDLGDDDRAALLKIYEAVQRTVERLHGSFQVIAMEHADLGDNTFRSSVVQRWRDNDEALVPSSWIDQTS